MDLKQLLKNMINYYFNKIKQKIQTCWRLLFISIYWCIMCWCNSLSPTDGNEEVIIIGKWNNNPFRSYERLLIQREILACKGGVSIKEKMTLVQGNQKKIYNGSGDTGQLSSRLQNMHLHGFHLKRSF